MDAFPNLLESICPGLPLLPFLRIESETLCWATIPLFCECLLLSALGTLTALPFPVMWTRHHLAHCHFSPPCRSSPHSTRAIELHDRPVSCKVFFPYSTWTMKLSYPSGTPLSHALGLQKPVLGRYCHLIYTTQFDAHLACTHLMTVELSFSGRKGKELRGKRNHFIF